MELMVRVLEEEGEIVQPAEVFEATACSLVLNRPIVAVAVEDTWGWGLGIRD
jgi:hypothetical protein